MAYVHSLSSSQSSQKMLGISGQPPMLVSVCDAVEDSCGIVDGFRVEAFFAARDFPVVVRALIVTRGLGTLRPSGSRTVGCVLDASSWADNLVSFDVKVNQMTPTMAYRRHNFRLRIFVGKGSSPRFERWLRMLLRYGD
jgi:hypothetical protein